MYSIIIFSDKPPIEDLQYFLDFQIARVWAPEQNNLQRKEPVCLSLQFSLMGPKLYISPDQVFFILFSRFPNISLATAEYLTLNCQSILFYQDCMHVPCACNFFLYTGDQYEKVWTGLVLENLSMLFVLFYNLNYYEEWNQKDVQR